MWVSTSTPMGTLRDTWHNGPSTMGLGTERTTTTVVTPVTIRVLAESRGGPGTETVVARTHDKENTGYSIDVNRGQGLLLCRSLSE